MIKKIYIMLLLTIILCSCGIKGDPVYKEDSQISKNVSTQITVAS